MPRAWVHSLKLPAGKLVTPVVRPVLPRIRYEQGIRLRFRCGLYTRKKSPLPKFYRMPHRSHGVKVVGQVVDGVQDLGQDLVARVEVSQVGARIAGADAASAAGVERAFVLSIARLLDGDPAFRSEQQTVAGGAGGQDAIHHVNAHGGILHDFLGRADAHEVAGPVGGQVRQRGGNDFLTCPPTGPATSWATARP